MANNLYTTKTAALKATKADINKLDAKKMLLNGKNIEELWGLNLPQDYPKLITRAQLFEDDNYALYDDYGNLLFMNFSDKIVNGSNMFYQKNITTFNYNLSSLTNGSNMFYGCENLTTVSSNLSSLTNGSEMFRKCSNLTTFYSDLSSLTYAWSMFSECRNLTTFASDSSGSPVNLSSLTNGNSMFYGCSNLTTFKCNDLSNLEIGRHMFQGTKIESFNVDLSSVTDGYLMFAGCSNLESFSSDLSNLTYGYCMFQSCSNLTTFNADLSSLTNGGNMFSNCNLDNASIENIFSSIPTYTSGSHELYVEVQQSGANKIQEITGITPSQTWQTTNYKGWQISFKIKS